MHPSNTKDTTELALREAIADRDPFCSGVCVVPDYQVSLYYRHDDDQHFIDFSKASEDELEKLYQACKPAPFGRGGETVVDETFRKAGKMDTSAFSTLFDPRTGLGIRDHIAKGLLTDRDSADMEVELYKLNVYGKGDFFKSHKDTPRSQDMFGSLVVILPSKHEGGQLVLHDGGKDWTIDFSDKIAEATQPSVYFVAFFGDINHEVLPVTSGYRVTLTYNLYHKPLHSSTSYLPTPFTQKLKRALINVVNNKSKLPNGGYLGFGLAHEYIYSADQPVAALAGQLKGSDRALADICDELGLKYALKLFYEAGGDFCLLTSRKLHCPAMSLLEAESFWVDSIKAALEELTTDDAEGVMMVDAKFNREDIINDPDSELTFMRKFYRDPISEVLAITPMKSSVLVDIPYMILGNEASLDYLYGSACMIVSVDPADSRAVFE